MEDLEGKTYCSRTVYNSSKAQKGSLVLYTPSLHLPKERSICLIKVKSLRQTMGKNKMRKKRKKPSSNNKHLLLPYDNPYFLAASELER